MGGKGIDQTGIGAFRGLDRAETAVMGRVNVTNGETGTFAGESPRAKSRDPSLVGELCQWIGLIHELAQLTGAEELLDRRHQWLGVDQLGGCE